MPEAMPEAWFEDFADGDFRLANQGITIFADIAEWNIGDPIVDIEGDMRPGVDGSPDYPGADVPDSP
jgi:hypothetical protein